MRARAIPESPLTSSALDGFVAKLGAAAKQAHSQFIVVYYIGHSPSWPNGDVAVVLGEAEPIPEPKREYTNEAISERVGTNVGALFQLADTLNANLEKLPPGYMPLRDFYAELDKIGIPFALLVDGCLRNEEFEQFRNSLGLTTDTETRTFFYTGPDGKMLSSLDAFDQKLRHFADGLPYLHTANPVILAAKPGTFAQPWPDPDLDWSQVGSIILEVRPLLLLGQFTHNRGPGRFRNNQPIAIVPVRQFKNLAGCERRKPFLKTAQMVDTSRSDHDGLTV
jgi:hypothetical protein